MDGISAAASVLQVATLGFELAKSIHKFISTARSANKELQAVGHDIRLLAIVLRQTHDQIRSHDSVANRDALKDFGDVLDGTREAFQEVKDLLAKFSNGGDRAGSISTKDRMRYAFNRKEKVELLRANLEKRKTTLLLMLGILGLGHKKAQIDGIENVELAKMGVDSLLRAKDNASKKYEDMAASLAKLEATVTWTHNNLNAPLVFAEKTPSPPEPLDGQDVERPADGPCEAVGKPSCNESADEALEGEQTIASSLQICVMEVQALAARVRLQTILWQSEKVIYRKFLATSCNAVSDALSTLHDEYCLYNQRQPSKLKRSGAVVSGLPPRERPERRQESSGERVPLPNEDKRLAQKGRPSLRVATHKSPRPRPSWWEDSPSSDSSWDDVDSTTPSFVHHGDPWAGTLAESGFEQPRVKTGEGCDKVVEYEETESVFKPFADVDDLLRRWTTVKV